MPLHPLHNLNIRSCTLLPTPKQVLTELPQSPKTQETVFNGRAAIEQILDGESPRTLIIVGPCSIHDPNAALEYAERLDHLRRATHDTLEIVMRVYFEKPRSSLGWQGLINDPFLDGSFRIDEGIRMARRLLLRLAEMGMPTATEALDPLMPQYLGDLVAWTAIGARTTESQTHRAMASGLSTPVGFKNNTEGSVEGAINAMRFAMNPQHFVGTREDGLPAVFATTGNAYLHLVLRGGRRPNYRAAEIAASEAALTTAGLPRRILIDCSHGNSNKDPAGQIRVLRDGLTQIRDGNSSIIGFMLESNLDGGRQDLDASPAAMRRGVSITDACIDWPTTENAIREAHAQLQAFRTSAGTV